MDKIANEKVEVSNGIQLNEKDYCICLLTTLKEMEKNYCIVMTEASNEWLYQIYRDVFLNISDLQRKVYNLMFQNGWYELENVTKNKLSEKDNMLNREYKNLVTS